MASRHRRSAAGPSSAQRRSATINLPEYQTPSHPLNRSGQLAVQQLLQTHRLEGLKAHQKQAIQFISESAEDINDQYTRSDQSHQRRKAKREQAGVLPNEADEEREQGLRSMRSQVDDLTKAMEEGIRKMIDGQQAIVQLEGSITHILESSMTASQRNRPSQSQRRTRTQATQYTEDMDEEMEDVEPSQFDGPGISTLFRQHIQTQRDRYQSSSLHTRYAENNDYVGFRRGVHDAQYGEEGPPLPHASTWFTESGSPTPGIISRDLAGGGGEVDDDDEDIAILREKISTKCPLTLKEFQDPMTSKRCHHSFEREAILGLIEDNRRAKIAATRRGRGTNADTQGSVECPCTGCSQILVAADLYSDKVLIRKIRRLQSAIADEGNLSDEGSDSNNRSEPLDVDDVDDFVRGTPAPRLSVRPKAEPRSSSRTSSVTLRGSGRSSTVPHRRERTALTANLSNSDDE